MARPEPEEQVFWRERTVAPPPCPPLEGRVEAGAVVVGGGITGLSAAQALREAGVDVVLVEAVECGAGATGRSSGFITPDSELQLEQLCRRFGDDGARRLWSAAQGACRHLDATIARLGIECDRVDAGGLFVASRPADVDVVRAEHEAHARLGFESRFVPDLAGLLGARRYAAGLRTDGTFGVDPLALARGLRRGLLAAGARLFEGSPATAIEPHRVMTPGGRIEAEHVVVCLDRFAPGVGVARAEAHHAQTSLLVSEPLDPALLARVFPAGPLLVWDSDLIYGYLRPLAGGRLMVGGGSLRHTYGREEHGPGPAARLRRWIEDRLPLLEGVRFTHRWPGLIGITRDLLPIAGPLGGLHLALCGAGLPWSVLAGQTAARRALGERTELDAYFDPVRPYGPLDPLQPALGKAATFALSNYLAKYHQRGAGAATRRQQALVRLGGGLAAGGLLAGLTRRLRRRR